jgi:hypothetical protein
VSIKVAYEAPIVGFPIFRPWSRRTFICSASGECRFMKSVHGCLVRGDETDVSTIADGGRAPVERRLHPELRQVTPPGDGTWMLQNRAHAHFNSVYMLCPNVGPVYLHPGMEHPYDIGGGNSHIVDYLGNVVAYSASGYNTFVSAIVADLLSKLLIDLVIKVSGAPRPEQTWALRAGV